MRQPLVSAALLALLLLPAPLRAGLHYSGESFAELPSRWRGFLLDHRALRTAAVKPARGSPAGPVRARYEREAARLARLATGRKLSADEAADLGALYVRLGEVGRALEVLRPAQRAHPAHYRLVANLGTAWQLHGELTQAAACLEQAARLAPGQYQKAEQLHLKLVRLRARAPRGARGLDNLFGVRYVGPGGKYEPGRLAEAQRKALPAGAVAQAQLLALWLPADARLLWQLGELAGAHGDVATSAAILDGCVTEFGLRGAELQAHRRALRAAADERARTGDRPGKAEHSRHALPIKPRSARPLLASAGKAPLPPVKLKGLNPLPWEVVAETTLDRRARPTFPRSLEELDGKQVEMRGYMQPLGEGGDLEAFLLIEYPVGCWYCEMPEITGIVLVELPGGESGKFTREAVRVTGKLTLNATDPENFLYLIGDAKVSAAE
jgi:hypothetical protein